MVGSFCGRGARLQLPEPSVPPSYAATAATAATSDGRQLLRETAISNMVKATHKHRTAARNKRRITAHSDAGKASRKQLQKNLSRKFQKKLDVVKRKRRKKIARLTRERKEREAAAKETAELEKGTTKESSAKSSSDA